MLFNFFGRAGVINATTLESQSGMHVGELLARLAAQNNFTSRVYDDFFETKRRLISLLV